ncbi:DHA2 family efflux MFS transporter permease subunit [Aquihabitans sp. G128]|nr:DHA2 family efflux MFS transporter permease subunit [Aquihabitans sp. G128]
MVIGVDNTILNVALPKIVGDLGAKGSQLQWMIDAYTIVFASLLLTAGALGDRFGRKRMLHGGVIVFGTCSTLAAFSGSATGLIGARALMGIGGAAIFPTTLSILTNTFTDPAERAKAIGIWAGVTGLGVALGPLGGGLLLEHFWWGSVFLVNVPLCLAALVLGWFVIPDSKDPSEGRLDPLGSLLSIGALFGILFALIEGPDQGWLSAPVVGAFLVGAALLAAFAWWELHCEHPMLDLHFFSNPRFSAASATITLTYFALFGSTFLLTQYFQFVLGYSPLKAGFMTAPVAVGLMVGGPTAPRLVRRFGTKYVVTGGLTLVGLCLLTYASDTAMSSLAIGGVVRLLFGLGIGLTTAPATESIMGSLPRGKAGVGSAVNDTTRQTGGALGVAVLGSIFSANYRSIIDGRLAGVPPAAAEAARDSIGKAVGVLDKVPAGTAQVIRGDADHAYLQSMHVVYPIAAAAVALAALITLRYLPARASVAVDDVADDADERTAEELSAAIGLEDALPDVPHQVDPAPDGGGDGPGPERPAVPTGSR